MELIDIIRNRRSIRKYSNQKIDRETLTTIAEAGLFALMPEAGKGPRSSCWMMLS